MTTNIPTNADLHDFAKLIAAHLGTWQYDEKESTDLDGNPGYCAFLRRVGSEARVSMHVVCKGSAHRFEARAHAPYYINGNGRDRFELPYGFERASRTFGASRPASRVAAEIATHILPCARQIAEMYREACEEHDRARVEHQTLVTVLRPSVDAFHHDKHARYPRSTFDVEAGRAKVRGDVKHGGISLEIDGVNPGQVARIVALLRESAHA